MTSVAFIFSVKMWAGFDLGDYEKVSKSCTIFPFFTSYGSSPFSSGTHPLKNIDYYSRFSNLEEYCSVIDLPSISKMTLKTKINHF